MVKSGGPAEGDIAERWDGYRGNTRSHDFDQGGRGRSLEACVQ